MVGVADHFPADARLLEDVHRLQQQRRLQADVARDRGKGCRAAECIEHRVEVVHRVAELVEAQVRICAQPAGGVKGVLFEEAADRLAAAQEVLVARVQGAAVGCEDRGLLRRWHVQARQFHRTLAQREAAWVIDESGKHQETVAPIGCELRRRQELEAHRVRFSGSRQRMSPAGGGRGWFRDQWRASPASAARRAARSVRSQLNPGSSRPKCP
jgi:hypothetical protein